MSGLNRTLSLKDAISVVAGSMIGSGIFIVSSHIAFDTNSAILLILIWMLAGFITMLGALSYGELSSTISSEGGQYVYLKNIFSEKLAFIYGWTLFLVIQTGTLAAVNIAFAKFMGLIFPTLSSSNVLFSIGQYSFSAQQLFAIITVLIITFINSRGIKAGVIVQNIFTITKVLSILAIIFCGIFFAPNLSVLAQNFSLENNQITFNFDTLRLVGMSIVGALFASITWNNVTFITSEIKNPKKNIKIALFVGTLLVISLYFLLNMIYLINLPLDLIKTSPENIVVAQLAQSIFGQKALYIIAIIIAISAFGCANGMILTGSRVYYKMAKDRIFFRSLAIIDRKTKVPQNSLWLQGFWICILILWGNYAQLLDYVIYSSILFYTITIFGIFKMRKLYPNVKDVYRVPNFVPITFCILASFILIILTIFKPQYTIPGLLITLLGIPIYHHWKK
ncbi:MAG: amino acid permease [Candidatus Gastranaerophilales bacterium]|nr:amino acid permease [Candidatus Gastranaerophilales bacterium]